MPDSLVLDKSRILRVNDDQPDGRSEAEKGFRAVIRRAVAAGKQNGNTEKKGG